MGISDANFPTRQDGATYHCQTKPGQVANSIITVGDPARLVKIAAHLTDTCTIKSSRGFNTISGTYKNTRVSVISIGMGSGMMDMMIREVRAVTSGPLAIVRFGSCGGVAVDAKVGMIAVASHGIMVSRF